MRFQGLRMIFPATASGGLDLGDESQLDFLRMAMLRSLLGLGMLLVALPS